MVFICDAAHGEEAPQRAHTGGRAALLAQERLQLGQGEVGRCCDEPEQERCKSIEL